MPLEIMNLGRYRLLRQLGGGGMGEVYLAEDTRINRQVAIKIVRSELVSGPNAQLVEEANRLFVREMQAISRLDHPHILPLYDYGEEINQGRTTTYMVMPYRPEGSLEDWLYNNHKKLRPEEVAVLMKQAAEALQHAHDRQIIHQDVKPSNFLVHNTTTQLAIPELLLTDFGIAKTLANTSAITQNVRGTPIFMAPEQWEGHPVPATDQYALAIMAYFLLTGVTPFQGGPAQVMHQHYTKQPTPPSQINPQIPQALDAVLLRALAKSPGERYSSILAFANSFQQATRQTQQDLHVTLAISRDEAERGTVRTLNLPGRRQLPVSIPAHVYQGQILRLEGQGDISPETGACSSLLITLSIAQENAEQRPQNLHSNDRTVASGPQNWSTTPAYSLTPPPPPVNYPPIQISNGAFPSGNQADPKQEKVRPTGRRFILPLILVAILIIVSSGLGLFAYNNYTTGIKNAQSTQVALNAIQNATATQQSVAATATQGAIAAATTTAVAQAQNTNPYVSAPGKLILADPLSTASTTWQKGDNVVVDGSCFFTDNSYHAKENKNGYFIFCSAHYINVSDFVFEVHMKILNGHCGGILFRQTISTKYYLYRVCQDGNYGFIRYVDNQGSTSISLRYTASPVIHQGSQENIIAVAAQGNRIHLYVNNSEVDAFDDGNYLNGGLALIADDYQTSTEVVYTNMRLWNLVV